MPMKPRLDGRCMGSSNPTQDVDSSGLRLNRCMFQRACASTWHEVPALFMDTYEVVNQMCGPKLQGQASVCFNMLWVRVGVRVRGRGPPRRLRRCRR